MDIYDGRFHSSYLPHWLALQKALSARASEKVVLDGQSLNIASIVAIARFGSQVSIDLRALEDIQAGSTRFHELIQTGEIVYGVNTGFGGSASSRPSDVYEVQNSLMRLLGYGILADESSRASARSIDEMGSVTSMPESWIRAAMAVRINSLAQGASGVRPVLVQNLAAALNYDIVPLVPLRGSISASGDLSPLSYIGGMLQGKPTIRVYANTDSKRQLTGADEALRQAHISPIQFLPKEGLAVVNGTAISSAVGSLAVFEAHSLLALSQVLTAMTVESLQGSIESFDPLLAALRPHPGQTEVANNIRHFLSSSSLVYTSGQTASKQQDRYSIRTSSQWLGPVLEDFNHASRQITTELNSVTDNPLITPPSVDSDSSSAPGIIHGGNFQAKSVTTAMESLRQGLESIGHLQYSQVTELMNPATNNGLAPNLVVDEPHSSWLWKGADIMVAALASELGFLAGPVGNHVKVAETGNQALNSLALVSARYTMVAVEVLMQLSAVQVVVVCHALDLRALEERYMTALKGLFESTAGRELGGLVTQGVETEKLAGLLWSKFWAFWKANKSMNSGERIAAGLNSLDSTVLEHCIRSVAVLDGLSAFKAGMGRAATQLYFETRDSYVANPDATKSLGQASARMYRYVRQKLRIPFVGEKLLSAGEWKGEATGSGASGQFETPGSVGAMITKVYNAMKGTELYGVVAACHAEAAAVRKKEGTMLVKGGMIRSRL